jgi:hypothetical protein
LSNSSEPRKSERRFSAPTVLVVAAVVGAGAFAAGRSSFGSAPANPPFVESATAERLPASGDLPEGHPAMGNPAMVEGELPPGHPPIDPGIDPAIDPGAHAQGDFAAPAQPSLSWTAPPRWQKVPNPSTMRLATYRVPHEPGDDEDPELSVSQAGGAIDANAARWVGQFDPEGKKTAKQTVRKVGDLEITIVEVEGTFSGAMGRERGDEPGWALLGAIVATPGMPHFFKLTGPAKSVKAARVEFDSLIASLKP